jgi:ABC-2 type transport system permease protein
MTAHLAYLWLETKRQWRNREILVFRLGIPTVIYLILIAVQDAPDETTRDVPWATGRMVALAALAAVNSGLAAGPAIGDERGNGWLRQLRVTPLRPSAAVIAKTVVAMSFALPAIALVAAIGAVTDDIALSAGQWVEVIGLMWIATAAVAAVGTLIGLIFAAESAHHATTLAFVVLWLLGGIFTPTSSMPDALAAVANTLPSAGLIELGESIAIADPIPASAVAVLVTWTAAAGALAALSWRRVLTR